MKSTIFREVLVALALAILVYVGINISLQNSIVMGNSMHPNLQDGERVWVNKLAYHFGGSPKRGDIVVFKPPAQVASGEELVKRIIGLPGEIVEIRDGRVYITQTDTTEICLNESAYISQPILGTYKSGVIPDGHYFVMGDNRNGSGDSRGGWTVPKSDIVGKAWLAVWPPSKWGLAPNRVPGTE